VSLGFVDPLIAVFVSFVLLGIMLYKRVHLGVTLVSTAIVLSLLSVEVDKIPPMIFKTSVDPATISLVSAAVGIMVLSTLYKETNLITELSESLSRLIRWPKVVSMMLPALIGLLPVPGGALMSAPLVETEGEKLRMKEEKKAYVNVWFRHTILLAYPMSQALILTSALSGVPMDSLILRQLPIVIVTIISGYFIGLWKVSVIKNNEVYKAENSRALKSFLLSFSPILATIILVIIFGVSIPISVLAGIVLLLLITKPKLRILTKILGRVSIYEIGLASYGAMLLRSATTSSNASTIIGNILKNANLSEVLLVSAVPAVLGSLVGSPPGGIAISVSTLTGAINFTPKATSLLYYATFSGYLMAPTHLCLVLTTQYFKSSLGKVCKYMIPSVIISFATALLIYWLS